MNVAEWLARTGKIHGEREALFLGNQLVCDYREFARRAATIAYNLQNTFKVLAGDRVAIYSGNSTEYLEALYGIWFVGAVSVPINAKLHPREAAWIIDNAQASIVCVSGKLGNDIASVMPGCVEEMLCLDNVDWRKLTTGDYFSSPVFCDADDMAWLFYTSGTTGKPKGVMISHGNLYAMAHSYFVDVDTVTPDDAAFYAAPISHGAGIYNFMHVMKAARHVIPQSGGFDPAEIMDCAQTLRNLHMFAAPTMVRRLIDTVKMDPAGLDGIKTIVYGGGPMYTADIIEGVEVMGPKFCQIYGQGESPMTITALSRQQIADRSHKNWRSRLASVGTAQSSVEVKIADEAGLMVEVGEEGEILVRGGTVMSGYWRNEEATAEALRDGWLWTGDIGVMDDDGFLTLKDRSKDVIISGGTNIYPREVEEVLLIHEGVHEASVVGKPDEEWGEAVVAFIVAHPDADISAARLDALCVENIARFKRPKEYHFVKELPKNNYGKVLKTELRALLADGEFEK
ncbi:MAG: AMP-dependent synthetase [Hyphomicrobiales bacterium]|nr:MAG: AMP-dependent synthetase [Hyphomicrobiales bacterium]